MLPTCLPLVLLALLLSGALAEIDLSRADEPWRTSRTGFSETVPPPFEPVQMKGSQAEVWGRTYQLAFPFPAAVSSRGEALLAGPIRVVVRAGGKEEVIAAAAVELGEATPRRVSFSGRGGELVPVTVSGWLEYDGAIRIDLALEPAQPVTLDYVGIQVPVRRELALFYHAHSTWGKYLYGTVGEQPVIGEARTKDEVSGVDDTLAAQRPGDAPPAGSTPVTGEGIDWGFDLGWAALWWLGDHDQGLTIATETYRGWTGPQDRMVRLTRGPEAVTLALNWINEPTQITERKAITVAVQATPGKPLPENWHGRVVGSLQFPAGPAEASLKRDEEGVTVGFVWNNHTTAFSYPQMKEPEVIKQGIQAYHDAGVRAVVYITLSGTGNDTPVFERNREEWLMTNGRTQPLFSADGGADGGYTSCCPVSSYADWLVWAVDQAMGEYDLDGVYIDNAGPYYCDNPVHGHKGRDYPYFANREFQQRIWQVVRSHKPEDGIVWEHNSRTSNSLNLSYVDIYSDGEHFRVKSKGMPEEITPTLLAITGAGKQWGAQPCFLASALNIREEYTRWLLARLLPYGNVMMQSPTWIDYASFTPTLHARQAFGLGGGGVDWFTPEALPPWLVWKGTRTAPDGTTLVPAELIAGGYQRPDGAILLTVANWSGQKAAARIDLRPVEKHLGAPPVARDAETGALCRPIGVNLVLTVPANDFRLIRIDPAR